MNVIAQFCFLDVIRLSELIRERQDRDITFRPTSHYAAKDPLPPRFQPPLAFFSLSRLTTRNSRLLLLLRLVSFALHSILLKPGAISIRRTNLVPDATCICVPQCNSITALKPDWHFTDGIWSNLDGMLLLK